MNQESIKLYYERNTRVYADGFYRPLRWRAFRQYIAGSLLGLGLRCVLDLGCGPIPSLPDLVSQAGQYILLDQSFSNLIALESFVSGLSRIQADVNGEGLLPVAIVFEMVIAFGLFQYLDHPEQLVLQVANVLKPGGYFVLHNPSEYWTGRMGEIHGRGFSRAELVALLTPRFQIRRIEGYHFIRGERLVSRFLAHSRFSERTALGIWKLVFALEKQLNRFGQTGTDWFIVAQKTNP